jgi:hypothetical protein
MKIVNWGKVLFVINNLNRLNSLDYFDLEKFCISKGLDFKKISIFLEVANSIIDGESELVKLLKDEKTLLKQLEKINTDDLVIT